MPTKRKWTLAEIKAEAAAFDWSRLDAMTDEEIESAAAADPDSYLPTDEELEVAIKERAERLHKARRAAE